MPQGVYTSGYRLMLINMSLVVGLPVMLSGIELVYSLGFTLAVGLFALGGVVLAAIGWGAASTGAANRLSSYMIITRVFGTQGAKVINTLFAVSMWGWFGVNLTLFADAISSLVLTFAGTALPLELYMVGGAVFMVATAVFGFKALNTLSVAVVPVWALVMTIIAVALAGEGDVLARMPASEPSLESVDRGISAVVGMLIVGAVLLPDFTRYARRERAFADSAIAVVPAFVAVLPLVLLTAGMAGALAGERNPLDVLEAYGFGALAVVPILLAATIVNGINLYGCSLSLSTVFTRSKEWQLALASGTVGTLAALFGIIDHFIDFLELLSLVFTPIAGVYLVDFFYLRRRRPYLEDRDGTNVLGLVAVLAAISLTALLHGVGITVSGVKPCDALLLAALIYAGGHRLGGLKARPA